MTKKQKNTIEALIDTLKVNLAVDFEKPVPNADQLRNSVLVGVMESNQILIQNHLEEIGQYVMMKLDCIDELNRLNGDIERRLAMLTRTGERPPVPTETRSPKPSKAV